MTVRPQPAPYPTAGELIDGKYQVERMLGEGGMGAVSKAMHLLRRAPVALKFMSPSIVAYPGAVERFLNEGVAASQIDSDHVVHVYDVGKLPSGAPYLVMEYLEGVDLADLLAREGAPGLPVGRSVHFTLQMLRGLQVAHDAGVVHRDMKPSNAFVVRKEGESDFVKLLDFGISKVTQSRGKSLTQTNSALGTPLYMSPEQARSPRDVDHRTDLYSVSVILYELLTGRTPFTSESGEYTEILFKLFTTDPPPIGSLREDVPPGLAAVVHKGLARDANERFSSAADYGAALAPFAEARSARVIDRLANHEPRKPSEFPSDGAVATAAHFSRLQTGTKGSGADTEPPPPAAVTAHSASPFTDAFPSTNLGLGRSAAPPARVTTEPPPMVPDHSPLATARTDLGAARDATDPRAALSPPARRSRGRLLAALPVLVVLAALGFWLTHKGPAKVAPEASEAARPPAVVAASPPPAAPSSEPPAATVVPAAPQEAASASASAAPVTSASAGAARPPSATPRATPRPAPPAPSTAPRGPLRLKDLKPVE